MRKKILLSATLMFFCVLQLMAQKTIKGKITDATTQQPVANATVIVRGSTVGTQSDDNGNFTITVPNSNSRIVVSSVGFDPQDISLQGRGEVSVALKTTTSSLNEVVVTGYSSQRKKDITGAVSVVKVKDLESIPASTAENQLQGRAPGVTVISNSEPGSVASVRIRGFASFGGNEPLYIIDGVPAGSLLGINPDDIESMQILKDAASASIYGSRASNGVVIVTTNQGKPGPARVTYSMYYGTQDPGKGFKDFLTPQEHADLTWLALKNSNQPLTSGQYGSGATPVVPDYLLGGSSSGLFEGDPAVNPSLYDLNFTKLGDANYTPYLIVKANKAGTNWFKELTRKAPIMNHNLAVSGGSPDKSKYFFSFNYFNQDGIVVQNFYKRYIVRTNTEFNVKKNVRIGENIQLYSAQNNSAGNNGEGTEIGNSYRILPIIPVYNINGDFAGTKGANLGNAHNPVANRWRGKNNGNTFFAVFGNIYAEVDFLQHFTARTSFGGGYGYGNSFTYPSIEYENSENTVTPVYSESFGKGSSWTWTNQLTYKNSFGRHNVTALAGVEAVEDRGRGITASRQDYFSFTNLRYINLNTGSGTQSVGGSPQDPAALYSQFAKVDYDFNGKYFLSGTIRRDGSSRFSESNRYGYFPAGSIGWRISEEPFLKSVPWIADLKVRASYGEMGNQRIRPSNQFTQFSGSAGASFYDINGTSNSPSQGFYVSFIGNTAGKWETNVTANAGFDASLFKGTEITFDIYKKKTKDLLYNAEQLATAGGTASANPPAFNIGSMQNWGIDLGITQRSYFGGQKGVRMDATLTFTTYKNKITGIAEGVPFFDQDAGEGGRLNGVFTRNAVGHPIASYYGYKVVGLFQSADDVAKSPTQDAAAPGRFKYQDSNGDGAITPDDRVFIGDPNPKFSYGLNLNFTYKDFTLAAFFYGIEGKDAVNYVKWWTDFYPSFQGAKSKDALYNSWSPDRPNATIPIQENAGNFSTNGPPNSYYLENASYLRMKNLTIGYKLPSDFLKKFKIDRFYIYVQATNIFTITKYTGLDPEIINFDDRINAFDAGAYPTVKQYLVGATVNF